MPSGHPLFDGSPLTPNIRCEPVKKRSFGRTRVSDPDPQKFQASKRGKKKSSVVSRQSAAGFATGGRGFIFGRTYGTLGTLGTCGTRMRRNQKDFFSLNRRAGAAPQKISRKKVCHSVSLCPISPISPICLRNAPAAPSDRSSQIACR